MKRKSAQEGKKFMKELLCVFLWACREIFYDFCSSSPDGDEGQRLQSDGDDMGRQETHGTFVEGRATDEVIELQGQQEGGEEKTEGDKDEDDDGCVACWWTVPSLIAIPAAEGEDS